MTNETTNNDIIGTILNAIGDMQVRPNTMIMPSRFFRYGPRQKTRRQKKKFHERWAQILKRPVREMRLVAMGRVDLAKWEGGKV